MAADKIQQHRDQYAVGWIAALPCEKAAAKLMLQREHSRPVDFQQPRTDPNSYLWGDISGHNVVIASLPSGQYGTVSAASTALSMFSSFPRVRFVLMVGIGGGIPRDGDPDIRLGDVVVGQRIYQYDLGKIKTGEPWENTSHLNNPPQLLLSALAGLESDLLVGSSQVAEFIEEGISRIPEKKRKNFTYPGAEHDHLFQPDYSHPGGVDCASCDASKIVSREPREDLGPEIHIGNIASGNVVVKDAGFRDFVSDLVRADCICFEMEAAGLMNALPCLAIRGICDYADSHKNKQWQPYAAVAAAALAKDLLTYVVSEDIAAMPNALENVKEDIKQIKDETTSLVRLSQEKLLRDWLQPCDPSTNYVQARKLCLVGTGSWFLESHHYARWKSKETLSLWLHGVPGCGKTILSSTIIEDLKSANVSVLYFYFDFNDSKKTTLESMLRSLIFQLYIQNEKSQRRFEELFSPVRNGKEQPLLQELKTVLQNWLRDSQTYIVLDALDECKPRQELLAWFEAHAQNISILFTSRREHEIEASFEKWMSEENRIAIQAETIDEDIRRMVQNAIQTDVELARWKQHTEIHSLIETSLMEKAQGMFRWAVCQLDTLRKCLDRKSLLKALEELPEGLNDTYARILKEIPNAYKPNAIRLLQLLTFSTRPLTLTEAVDALAVDLEKIPHFDELDRMPMPQEIASYCGSLTAVVNHETVLGKEIELQLAHLSVREYLVSMHIDDNIKPHFDEIQAKSCIVQICLAYLFEASQKSLLTNQHISFPFEEFAADHWIWHGPVAEKDEIALEWIYKLFTSRDYFIYSMQKRFFSTSSWRGANNDEVSNDDSFDSSDDDGFDKDDADDDGSDDNESADDAFDEDDFFQYDFDDSDDPDHDDFEDLDSKDDSSENDGSKDDGSSDWDTTDSESNKGYPDDDDPNDLPGPLYLASEAGMVLSAKRLLDKGVNINAKGKYTHGETAIRAALRERHFDIAKLLLDHGAKVSSEDSSNIEETLLGFAIKGGSVDTVRLLLDNGANINAQDKLSGDNALFTALRQDQGDIVELLLDRGADINIKGGYGVDTALTIAAERGHADIVKLLLDRGSDINKAAVIGQTPLSIASTHGRLKTVQLLLERKADTNKADSNGRTALFFATMSGRTEVVKLLLDQKETPSMAERVPHFHKDHEGRTVFHYAARGGNPVVIDYLLETYLSSNAKEVMGEDKHGRNILDYASMSGSLETIQKVLELYQDRKLSLRSSSPWSPLHWACRNGSYNILALLIEAGIETKEVETLTPAERWSPWDIVLYWENTGLVSIRDEIFENSSWLRALKTQSVADTSSQAPPDTFRSNALPSPGKNFKWSCDGCFLVGVYLKYNHN